MAIRKQPKQRNINRWNDDLDKAVLLWINHTCVDMGIKLPYDEIARRMGSTFTGGGIVQHLSKLRNKMAEQGQVPVPPPPRRGAVTLKPSTIYASGPRAVRLTVKNPQTRVTKAKKAISDRIIKRSDSDMDDSDEDDYHSGDEDDAFRPKEQKPGAVVSVRSNVKEKHGLERQLALPPLPQPKPSGDRQFENTYKNLRDADQAYEQEKAKTVSVGIGGAYQPASNRISPKFANKYNVSRSPKDDTSFTVAQPQMQGQSMFDASNAFITPRPRQTGPLDLQGYSDANMFNLPDISEAAMAYQFRPAGGNYGLPELDFTDFNPGQGIKVTAALPTAQTSPVPAINTFSPAPSRNHSMNSVDSVYQAGQTAQETNWAHDDHKPDAQQAMQELQNHGASCSNLAGFMGNTHGDALPQLPSLEFGSWLDTDTEQQTAQTAQWNTFGSEIGMDMGHWNEAGGGLFGIQGLTPDTY